ncbi:enoyl-CoA hydratase/isomerase family protein, partial [Pseudomonas sp. 2822-17]|uniref:enoyl-CoA hydratase/isomerase family protein n=1 Tax=Pseudomonas sp. 2822-17 TaxID=1712678 RepID=UPI00117AF093
MPIKNKTVLYEVREGVGYITMNRPHVKNAIDEAMHEELYIAFKDASQNNEVKVILLTGQDGAFSSGAD